MTYARRFLAFIMVLALAAPILAESARRESPEKWYRDGQAALEQAKRRRPIDRKAKNVILFVADGMGVSTVTAARILEGQLRGQAGEENILSFERLPYTAVIKTYNTNQQTSDSAGTMVAMVTGVKTRAGVLSVNQYVRRKDHEAAVKNKLTTIVQLAEQAGFATGIVTTSRVTHATPAACFAHSPERNWEDDAALTPEARAADFPDIARQLIEFSDGDGLDVVLGGGRMNFLPNPSADPQYPDKKGRRLDGRNLIAEWTARPGAVYVKNKEQLDSLDKNAAKRVLGLFSYSHMEYEHDRKHSQSSEPSLSHMTDHAIDLLARNEKGYFLMVEGARIDHAHHEANAFRALTDTIEFANAVQVAMDKTKREETLIIVTADHSHVFTMAGYPTRGNPILGKVVGNDRYGEPGSLTLDMLGLPYTTLGYANGPGYTGESNAQSEGVKRFPHYPRHYKGIVSGRPDLGAVDTHSHDYLVECTVPLDSETHGGEDVIAYADGPMAHLMTGVQEQNYIFHVMAAAWGLPASSPRSEAPPPTRRD